MSRALGRYRAIVVVAIPLAILAIFRTWHGPDVIPALRPDFWVLTYDNNVKKSVPAPIGATFVEVRPQGLTTIDMILPACLPYKRYRMWVGGFGKDSTDRQPQSWKLLVLTAPGTWAEAGAEHPDSYENNRWYAFPLTYHAACIDHVRMEISRPFHGGILRLYSLNFLIQ